ncbi:hypothetical protein SAMN05192584_12210 [Streptomyces pini]|uniref:Uncharacterized protein n=2 Tax=Streptomyces pini TaxID=1520580 RepID=A0A1I4IUF9_9ACTN|nr:hypothetical protein SAMN05192584_12210 [Streptomyces pini]
MLVEEFERIERAAPETVRLEFVHGRPVVKPGADGARGATLVHLVGAFLAERPEPALCPYRGRTTRPYGAVVGIPDPVGITLRTVKLRGCA